MAGAVSDGTHDNDDIGTRFRELAPIEKQAAGKFPAAYRFVMNGSSGFENEDDLVRARIEDDDLIAH